MGAEGATGHRRGQETRGPAEGKLVAGVVMVDAVAVVGPVEGGDVQEHVSRIVGS